jgi:hypothetical protein
MAKKVNDELQPWERQPGETTKAFQAFQIYRDLGIEDPNSRTLLEAARRVGKHRNVLNKWKRMYNWEERCRHFDVEQDRLRLAEKRRRIDRANREHLNLAQVMLGKVAKRLEVLKAETELTPRDLNTMIEVATKIQRLALGMSTNNIQSEVSAPGGEPLQGTVIPVTIYIPDNGRGDRNGGGGDGRGSSTNN